MSRLTYNEGLDVADIMAMGRWERNTRTTLKSARGQQMLKELEEALLALPEKRLLHGKFFDEETGEVCAMGAYAKYKGATPEELHYLEGTDGEEQAYWISGSYKMAHTLIWNLIDLNDEGHVLGYPAPWREKETPEQRYERVLKFVQEHIVRD